LPQKTETAKHPKAPTYKAANQGSVLHKHCCCVDTNGLKPVGIYFLRRGLLCRGGHERFLLHLLCNGLHFWIIQ
jgi:hypothetical protein